MRNLDGDYKQHENIDHTPCTNWTNTLPAAYQTEGLAHS